MAGRVDLDAIQTRLATRYGEVVIMPADDVLALVDELRATREVVDHARKAAHAVDLVGTTDYSARVLFDLGLAVAAFDRAVGRAAAADQPPGDG